MTAATDRLAQFPGRKEAGRFLRELLAPRRASAVRAVVDGVVVVRTLKSRGVRPLLAGANVPSVTLDVDRSVQVSEAVDAGLGLLPVAPTCLRRSVTLLRELNRLGLTAAMHVGVRTVGGAVEAHAWVQVGDVVVNDDPEITRTYTELAAGDVERLVPLLP